MRKLTNDQQTEIATDYIRGNSIKELSAKYEICTWSICNVLKKHNVPTRIRKYKCNEKYFEKIDTSEKSYWLGLFFADGYTRKRRQNNNMYKQGGIAGLSLRDGDEYLLEELITDIESNYVLSKTINKGFINYRIEINSVKITNDLIRHGCVIKKSLKLLPPKIDENLQSNFIRGYIDGDGCIGVYKKRFKLSILGTEAILQYILNYFLKHGIESSPKIGRKGNICTIQFNSQKDLIKIYKLLYTKECTRFLKRKKKIFNRIIYN